jgi:DNA-binding NarL/FixJ family response regulator
MCELDAILTPRQIEIAVLVVKGYTNKEIASKLGISSSTLNHHMFGNGNTEGIHNKLGITKDRQIFKAMYKTHYIDESNLSILLGETND